MSKMPESDERHHQINADRTEYEDASDFILINTVRPYAGSEFSNRLAHPTTFFGAIEDAALTGQIVAYGMDGPPGSGKSSTLLHGDSFMFDPDQHPRLFNVSQIQQREIVVYDLEWGGAYQFFSPDEMVGSDYHDSEELREKKKVELEKVGKIFFTAFRNTLEFAKQNPDRNSLIQLIRYDKPLITGLHIDGIEVGMARGDEEFRELVVDVEDDPDVELFAAGIFANSKVRRFTHRIREELNAVKETDDGEPIEMTTQEKRKVLEKHNIYFASGDRGYTEEEVDRYIRNMAKPHQMRGISRDIEQVRDYLLSTGRIAYSSVTGERALSKFKALKHTNPERYEQYEDELTGSALHWILHNHIGVRHDRGAIFENADIVPIANKKTVIPVRYLHPIEMGWGKTE